MKPVDIVVPGRERDVQVELLVSMMRYGPDERPFMDTILQQPWIQI